MSFFDFFKSAPRLNCNADAWSQGQIRSKLWLVEELERRLPKDRPATIWVLGGWYCLTGFLLLSRGRVPVSRLCSFDLDAEANRVARLVNGSWTFDPAVFHAYEQDCEKLEFASGPFGPAPDVVINTAMEHFSPSWIRRVPGGTYLALQSTDMPHHEHTHPSRSLREFREGLPGRIAWDVEAEQTFDYPRLKFSRYMVLGRKIDD